MDDGNLRIELQSLEHDLRIILKRLSALNQPALVASMFSKTERDEKWERIYEDILSLLRDKPDRLVQSAELNFKCSRYRALNPPDKKAVLQNMVARGLITVTEKRNGRRPATIITLAEKRILPLPGRKTKPTPETPNDEY